ncbi:MAG TPA: tetrahydromethanopterin S-methyltransferase subunit A [Methanosarcinales archaeon]|nr:tetrahydromethanopterin S-methyltransferase subunit A [Methanosarcinales archaeon]
MSDDTIAKTWPPVRGDYTVVDPHSRICVATLASDMEAFPGACMVGSCKTENLGIEKIIINTISNSNIRFILVCGTESKGHLSGNTLLAIHKNGIDEQGRIIGSDGAIPFIENIPAKAIERFRQQVELIDRRGLIETNEILELINEYRSKGNPFPEPPMVLETRKKKQKIERNITGRDMMIAPGILMDSTSGVIFAET